jgi:2-polyprenyl-3-methyl-5-hydroxy-6-metoxy-1,4-benzoquinol methylase
MTVEDIRGLHYNPISRSVRLGGNVDVNFLVHARKSEPLE